MIDAKKTQDNIRSIARLRGITRRELALGCNVTKSCVNKWYYRPDSLPNLESIVAIADFLNVSVDDLIVRK